MKSYWLESKAMFFLFSCSAWVVACLGIFMVFGLIVWGQQTKSFQTNNVVGMTLAALMVVIMIAILVIIFGMAIHCLSNGDFSIGTKILWSIFAFFTAPLGAALYFFTVYKKQTKIHREAVDA